MTDSETPSTPTVQPAPAAGEQPKPRNKKKNNNRQNRPPDQQDQNRPRPRGDRFTMAVYGDGIERAFCSAMPRLLPEAWPVNYRAGIAVINPIEVARRERQILLCTCQHAGEHIWPNNDLVEA